MFTGIIEYIGVIDKLEKSNDFLKIQVSSNCDSDQIKIGESIAINGVCLTIVNIDQNIHTVNVVKETLQKSNFSMIKVGSLINLERSLKLGDRLDGHIVQGHVDQTAECINIKEEKGSWIFTFNYQPSSNITIEKGSICVNGVSLTIVDSLENKFSVAIIPYTFENTNFAFIKVGDLVRQLTGPKLLSDFSKEVNILPKKKFNPSHTSEDWEKTKGVYTKHIMTGKWADGRKINQNLKKESFRRRNIMKGVSSEFSEKLKANVESAMESAQNELKMAIESQDANAQVTANKKIAALALENANLQMKKTPVEQDVPVQLSDGGRLPERTPRSLPDSDPQAESWASKNTWFGTDRAMTFTAFEIHKDLVDKEGFDPKSDEYYTEIDKRIRVDFPNKFGNTETQATTKPVQSVASANRSVKPGRKQVRLTSSQVAIAKKLGVPLEEYAKQLKLTEGA